MGGVASVLNAHKTQLMQLRGEYGANIKTATANMKGLAPLLPALVYVGAALALRQVRHQYDFFVIELLVFWICSVEN